MDLENEFMAKTPIFLPLNSDTMVITRGKRALAEMASIAIYGKPFEEVIADQKAEQAKILAEQAKLLAARVAEQAKLLAAKEAEQAKLLAAKEAEQALDRRNTIHALLKINFTPEKIADVLGFDLDYVLKVASDN